MPASWRFAGALFAAGCGSGVRESHVRRARHARSPCPGAGPEDGRPHTGGRGLRAWSRSLQLPRRRERRTAGRRSRRRTSGSRAGSRRSPISGRRRGSRRSACPGARRHRRWTTSTIYVAHLRAPAPGTYWVLAQTARVRRSAASATSSFARKSYSPAVGAKAPASRTPTLATTRRQAGAADDRDASRPAALHDVGRRRRSRARAVRRHVRDAEVLHEQDVRPGRRRRLARAQASSPTAACASSTSRCSRATIRRRATTAGCGSGDSRASRGSFLVGRDGRIKAKFEGPVSVGELRAAVESMLVA